MTGKEQGAGRAGEGGVDDSAGAGAAGWMPDRVAAGSWADLHFHQRWIGVAGIVLGAVAGFMQIFRTAARFLKDGRR